MADAKSTLLDAVARDAEKFYSLSPPFSDVRVKYQFYWSKLRIIYIGPVDTLVASGAIEPGMERVTTGKRPKRVDSFGDRYCREKLPKERLRFIRFVTDTERARRLPGVSSDDVPECFSWLATRPNDLYCVQDQWRMYLVGAKDAFTSRGISSEIFEGSGWDAVRKLSAYPAMNGFFSLTQEKVGGKAPDLARVAQIRSRPSYLRLVSNRWD